MIATTRESSHQLSELEQKMSLEFAKSVQHRLSVQIKEVKIKRPHDFDHVEKNIEALSTKISQIILELLTALNLLSFDKKLEIQFGVIHKYKFAQVKYGKQNNISLVINLHFLEDIAKEITKGNETTANARLRHTLAHEFFHIYTYRKYPKVIYRSAETTKNVFKDRSSYYLDKGEISADLFAIKHLLDQKETTSDQKRANEKMAYKKRNELWQRLFYERINQKIKNLFSKK